MTRYKSKDLPKGNDLRLILQAHFSPLHQSRLKFIVLFTMAALVLGTVSFPELACAIYGGAQKSSNLRRIQRFFSLYVIDYKLFAKCVVSWLGIKGKMILIIDRTNWQFGTLPINILTLAVSYQDMAVPLFFIFLPKKGNSNAAERIALLELFIEAFGKERIDFITADREFIGKVWFQWLLDQELLFYIRVKSNALINRRKKQTTGDLFRFLPIQKGYHSIRLRPIYGVELYLCGLRIDENTLLIVVCPAQPNAALARYRLRWQIETMFKAFKTRGFDIEQTHLTQTD